MARDRGSELPCPTRREALVAAFGGLCLCCAAPEARASDMQLDEVASGIFIRRGVDQDASASNIDAIANIGFIVGDEAVLVTDSGGSLADGQWLRAAIKAKTTKPIRYVVLSHVHPDHIFGAGAFAEDKPIYVGHAKLPDALSARGDFYRNGLAEIIGMDRVGPVVMPTRIVRDTDRLDLGSRAITLLAHGPAHTTCDLSMRDEKTGILFPADLLFVERVPSLDGSLKGWLKELEGLAAGVPAKAVPGHGPALVDVREASAALRTYLAALRDGVRAEIRGNGSIENAIKTVAQGQRARWALFDDYNGRNVTEAYKELEWD